MPVPATSEDFAPDDPEDTRAADARLVELVRAAGVSSPEFRYLRDILRESAMGSLERIGPRRILSEMQKRRLWVPVPPPASFAAEFPTLRFLAVDSALDGFMARQVMAGGWNQAGGASLRTFFNTNVIYSFVDHYRRYHREETGREALFGNAGDINGSSILTGQPEVGPVRRA